MPDARHPEEHRMAAGHKGWAGGHRGAVAARVLLVEGEPRLRSAIAEALGGAGLGVVAGSPDRAAEAAFGAADEADPAAPPPAVLVADTDPAPEGGSGPDALALAAEARRRWPHLGVVYLTGRRRPSRLDGQVLRARDRFLPKPVRPDALVRTVRGLLGGPGRR
jgi:DNA-binding response OmpR family regulator